MPFSTPLLTCCLAVGVTGNNDSLLRHRVVLRREDNNVPDSLSGRRDICSRLAASPHYFHAEFASEHFDGDYPLTNDDFRQIPLEGDYGRIKALMASLAAGEKCRILVLGGSETAGADCAQDTRENGTLKDKDCAWPARFAAWLRATFPQSEVVLDNLAVGGTPSCAHLARFGSLVSSQGRKDTDLVLLDPVINDFFALSEAPVCFENLIRTLRLLLPNAATFALFTGTPEMATLQYGYQEINIADYYRLPRLNFMDLVQASGALWMTPSGNGNNVDCKTGERSNAHPCWKTHQVMADAVANAWGKVLNSMCEDAPSNNTVAKVSIFPSKSLLPGADLQRNRICLQPLSSFLAENWTDAQETLPSPTIVKGDWSFREDRLGKPGWIAETPNSTIRFPVDFGTQPQLTVVYLRSYSGIGNVSISVFDPSSERVGNYILSGYWEPRVSQSETITLTAQNLPLQPNTRMDVELKVLPDTVTKVKIMDILSC